MILEYKVKDENLTINYILRNKLQISSRLFVKLLKNKLVYINGKSCDTRNIACIGDIVSIDLNYKEDNSNIVATNMPLDIIYEDNYLLILNKPAGIAIHPSMRHFDTSLSNGIKHYFDEIRIT